MKKIIFATLASAVILVTASSCNDRSTKDNTAIKADTTKKDTTATTDKFSDPH